MMMIPVHVIAFFLAIMFVPEDVNQFTIAVQGKEIQWTRQEAGWHAVELPRDDWGIYSVQGSEVAISGEGRVMKTKVSRYLEMPEHLDWKKATEIPVAMKSLGDPVQIQREDGKIVFSQAKGALFANPVTATWKLTDSKAQDFPKQIDIPISVGLKSDSEVRKWLDGIPEAGITGITHTQSKIETTLGEMAVTEYYRGDSLILKRVVPPDASHYTVYYVIHNGFEILTYKSGTAGTEFAGAGVIRDMVKPDYTIKMVGDKGGKIHRITIFSPDFSKTYESFWIKDKELIPWSAEQLQGWRKMRDPDARDEKMSVLRMRH